jgi:hypothetical protein
MINQCRLKHGVILEIEEKIIVVSAPYYAVDRLSKTWNKGTAGKLF